MSDSMRIHFDLDSALAGLDQLQQGVIDNTRPAAQAGAQVLYDEVLRRVPVRKQAMKRQKSGRVNAPGTLKNAIYQVWSKDRSVDGLQMYHVSWNAKKAPHGHLVEYGTSRAPAHPFVRPSYDAKKVAALEKAKARYVAGMQPVLQDLKK